jgi:ribosomal protein L13E
LSSRPKKAKGKEKAEPTKAAKAKPVKPTGKPPEATITSRHGAGFVVRLGRGFSMGELAGAGLSRDLASDWGLRLDLRRRSIVESNVASLRSWSSHPGTTKRTEGVAEEVKEEVEKVGREVKTEATKIEKEAVKEAEKVKSEVKKEAVKAKKVARRKSKPKKQAES